MLAATISESRREIKPGHVSPTAFARVIGDNLNNTQSTTIFFLAVFFQQGFVSPSAQPVPPPGPPPPLLSHAEAVTTAAEAVARVYGVDKQTALQMIEQACVWTCV